MPIVNELQSGLRRFAVLSFVEDTEYKTSDGKVAADFPKSPLTSIQEASCKLAHAEFLHMKRLKSVEKRVMCPFIDVTFFSSYQSVSEIYRLVEITDCKNLHNEEIGLQKACYEELQLVDPKRDMIQTPIDDDDPIDQMQNGKGRRASCVIQKEQHETSDKHLRGYIILAYKTMEDMYNREFVTSWKTWTGVRYICMALPRQLGLRRISFYRQLNQTSAFTYVLMIEISNLLTYAAQTLNLIDRIKLRLCGYVGVYREVDFKLDQVSADNLHLPTDFGAPAAPGTPRPGPGSIGVSVQSSIDIQEDDTAENSPRLTINRVHREPKVPVPPSAPPADSTPKHKPPEQPKQPPTIPQRAKLSLTGRKFKKKEKEKRKDKKIVEEEKKPEPPPYESPVKEKETLPERSEESAVEAEVHPQPMQPLVRLAGKGRIVRDPEGMNIFPKMSEITRPMIIDTERSSGRAPTPPQYSSRYYHHRLSSSQAVNPTASIVSAIPATHEVLQKDAYESIFKRTAEPPAAPPADFAALRSLYNSPVFSRTEWKQESSLYRNNNYGDRSMQNLAERLDSAPETDIVSSQNNNGRDREGSLIALAEPPRLSHNDQRPRASTLHEMQEKTAPGAPSPRRRVLPRRPSEDAKNIPPNILLL